MKEGPRYTIHTTENGSKFRMPYGFPAENFDSSLKYDVQDTDIILATYPKCGTTWTQHIIYMIVNENCDPLSPDQTTMEVFPHLEEVGKEYCESLPNPRLIKTHLNYDLTPKNPKAKYIYIVRNPKDCVVSFFYHTVGFVNCYDYDDGDFETFFDLFLKGEVDFGDYFENLRGWLDHRSKSNILFLTYEQMKENTRECILKIARHLGASYERKLLHNNEEMLRKVLNGSSFNEMKKDLLRWSSKRSNKHKPFIRRGIVGDWKNHLTIEQSNCIDEKLTKRFTAEEIEMIWPINP